MSIDNQVDNVHRITQRYERVSQAFELQCAEIMSAKYVNENGPDTYSTDFGLQAVMQRHRSY
jgi:hypothetical protein